MDNPVAQFSFGIITLFKDIFQALNYGITGKALEKKLVTLNFWDPKNYLLNPKERVDDKPFGGGPGMILRYQPLRDAIRTAKQELGSNTKVVYLSPQGQTLTQKLLQDTLNTKKLILLPGRYEGIDERIITHHVDEEWSIGDYILSGGEFACLIIIDAITRLLPGVLGNEKSNQNESFSNGLLDYPVYTRPYEIDHHKVPDVLLSGNHELIRSWRTQQALINTWNKRPDLAQKYKLSSIEEKILAKHWENINPFKE